MKNIKAKIPYPLVFPILIPLLFPFTFIGVMVSFLVPSEPKVRHIKVNGQDCIVKFVVDHRTSHESVTGHDEAICP